MQSRVKSGGVEGLVGLTDAYCPSCRDRNQDIYHRNALIVLVGCRLDGECWEGRGRGDDVHKLSHYVGILGGGKLVKCVCVCRCWVESRGDLLII